MKRIVAVSLVLVLTFIVKLHSSTLFSSSAPPVPTDMFHAVVIANAGCALCHAAGKQAPLREGHPPRAECFACHKPRQQH